MYQSILVPVDLAHPQTLEKALNTAADLARHYNTRVHYVAVAGTAPGNVARTPEEYQHKLAEFARRQGELHGCDVQAHVYTASDPVAALDDLIVKAAEDLSADLLVMATHPPKGADVLIPSNGDKVARHTRASVLLVRP